MPRVCADPTAFDADGGSLALRWDTVGTTSAEAQSGSTTIDVTGSTDGYVGPNVVTRLAFANNTTRQQVVRFSAHLPRVDMDMAPGNRWLVGLYLTSQMGSPPPDSTLNTTDLVVVRANQSSNATGVHRVTQPASTRIRHVIVDVGQTVHLMASVWRWIFVHESNAENALRVGPLHLEYDTHPSAS